MIGSSFSPTASAFSALTGRGRCFDLAWSQSHEEWLGYPPLIRPASEFREVIFMPANLDCLSNNLALLVRREEGDIQGLASTKKCHSLIFPFLRYPMITLVQLLR